MPRRRSTRRHPRVAVALVADQVVGPLAGAAPSCGPRHADRVQDRLELVAVVPLAGREHHAQRPAAAVAAKMDIGGQPAPGTPERLGLAQDDGAGVHAMDCRAGPCQRFARNCATRNLAPPHAPIPNTTFYLRGCVGMEGAARPREPPVHRW
jgi:hypothetical protein